MLTSATRIRLVIFVVVSVVVLAVTALFYVHLPQLLGFGQYTVTADFADSSGLYSNALVTYRGAQVGKVGAITLQPDGTTVELSIDDGTVIPANLVATIHSTSAIGEQYVDLVPRSTPRTRPARRIDDPAQRHRGAATDLEPARPARRADPVDPEGDDVARAA